MTSGHLLVVCTANMIRSPFVSELLRSRLAPGPREFLTIDSAGTAARPDESADPAVVERGKTYGLALDRHRTRRLDDGILRAGQTVLCAERSHRRVVLDIRPDLLSSVFTVREFARAAAAVADRGGVESWSALVQSAAAARRLERVEREQDDDIVDPVGQSDSVWLEFERQSTTAVSSILAAINTLPRMDADAPVSDLAPVTRRQRREMRLADAASHQRVGWRS